MPVLLIIAAAIFGGAFAGVTVKEAPATIHAQQAHHQIFNWGQAN